jgi:serine phosphatase RsbU (regulator of sigma subunit)
MNLVLQIEKFPKYLLFLISFIAVIIIGFFDYISGTELSFYIFYVLPVIFAVWFAGKGYGFFITLFCFAAWNLDTFFNRSVEINYWILSWNIFVQFLFFIIVIFSVSALKKSIKKREELEMQKITRELEIAKDVQQKLLPQNAPEIDGLDYSGICIPADAVGGDYFDYFKINKEEIAFAIGDIAGHGLSSALLMAGLVGFVRSNAVVYNDDLKDFMDKVNVLMCGSTDGSRFATFFYSVYNSTIKTLHFVNAGHNPPLLYKSKTKTFEELKTDGFIIGGISSFKYKDASINLGAGDFLLYYTDGITEAFNLKDEQFDVDRLKKVIEENYTLSSKEICGKIIESVKKHSEGREQADDMTLLAIKINS